MNAETSRAALSIARALEQDDRAAGIEVWNSCTPEERVDVLMFLAGVTAVHVQGRGGWAAWFAGVEAHAPGGFEVQP